MSGPSQTNSVSAPPPIARRLDIIAGSLWLAVCIVLVERFPRDPGAWDSAERTALALVIACVPFHLWIRSARGQRSPLPVRIAVISALMAVMLAAFALTHLDPIPALLAIPAAHLAQTGAKRASSALIVLSSVTLVALYARFLALPLAIAPASLYIAIQFFSALLVQTAVQAEGARRELAAANAQLRATQALLDETVRDRERVRIAAELHDLMGHKLTALQMNLQLLERRGEPDRAAQTCRQLATELLADTRAIVSRIRDHGGLSVEEAFQSLVAGFPEGLIALELDPDLRVSSGKIAHALVRSAQEAVTNALRHGRATRIALRLRRATGKVELEVRDNGNGTSVPAPGFGLASMRARIAECDGSLSLETFPGGGTRVAISVPDDAAAAA